jgi:NADH-quinone oxidoreductase subunit M
MSEHILSWITFFPLVGMVAVLLVPREHKQLIRWTAVITAFVPLALSVQLFFNFDRSVVGMQFVEQVPWIKAYNIEYFMGIDGLSTPMVLLTALLTFLCVFASFGIETGVKGYFALFLLLETGMMGVFCALDFFLFYVFWEIVLLPMYFLIGVWGGPRREYAAIKFFLYTLFGSVLMLVAMLALYFNTVDPATGQHSFNMLVLADQGAHLPWLRKFDVRFWLYAGLFVGFAIKVPIFPFHTWLPDAHVEAPTAVSVILAGVLLKMGTYGLLRISYTILPDMAVYTAFFLAAIGVVNIIYGALVAMAQTDFKKMIAYSSVSHMGYVLLGMAALTPSGMNGAVLQMFNHGCITAMLFLIVGVLYDRTHHRDLNGFGGVASVVPVYAGLTSLAFFASMGLPGLSGFISEVLVFIGAFPKYPGLVVIAVSGIIITAAYLLWAIQRVFLGPLNPKYRDLAEINGRELFTLVPLGVIVIILGVYPMAMLNIMSASMQALCDTFAPLMK